MVTRDFNYLIESVNEELEKTSEKIFQETIGKYFIYNPFSYISYLLAKKSYMEVELIEEEFSIGLAENIVINNLFTIRNSSYNEVATGLEILKYELTNFPEYSPVNNPTDFIEAIDYYIETNLADNIKDYENWLQQMEEKNKEFELEEETVVGSVNNGS